MFQTLRACFDRWSALRELRAADKSYCRVFAHVFTEQICVAKSAFDRGDRKQALEIWNKMRIQFPDLFVISEVGLNLTLDLGCYDEAEALMQAGRWRYPGQAFLLVGRARIAYRRGDLEEAIRGCEILRRKFPRAAEGYAIAATCLGDLARHDEAEAMIGQGVSKRPDDYDLCERHAEHATRRREWPEALRRWNWLWRRFKQIKGLLGAAQCLREMGRFAEAEKVLAEACERSGMNNPWPLAALADLATAKGEFEEAVECWERVLRRVPSFATGYTKCAEAMRKIGREAEADEVLRGAVTRFPLDLALQLAYARSAHRRGDWDAAIERWAMIRDRFPECAEARAQEAQAVAAANLQNSRLDAECSLSGSSEPESLSPGR